MISPKARLAAALDRAEAAEAELADTRQRLTALEAELAKYRADPLWRAVGVEPAHPILWDEDQRD